MCAIFPNEINHIKNRCTFSEDFCQIVLAVFVAYRYKMSQAMTPRDGDIEMNIQIDVGSELFEIIDGDGPQAVERFFVLFETSKGRRFQHEVSFPSVELAHDAEEGPYYRRVWDAADKAEALADRVRAHVAAGGKLDADRWVEVQPAYGSDAYIAFEASEIAPALHHLRHGGHIDDLSKAVRAYL